MRRPLRVAALAILLGAPFATEAAFTFNFSPDPAPLTQAFVTISCNIPGKPQVNCGTFISSPMMMGGSDPTPFLQELVRDASGNVYYHVIVGLPDNGQGFAQEYYSLQSFGPSDGSAAGSASFGNPSCFNAVFRYCNGEDPLGDRTRNDPNSTVSPMAVTGIGTGGSYMVACPTCPGGGAPYGRVAVRQLLGDHAKDPNTGQWTCNDSYCQEYLKPFDNKPRITQTLDDGQMRSEFVADMSASPMLVMPDTPAPVTNTLLLRNGMGQNVVSFDVTASRQQGQSTAGMYCRGVPDAQGNCRPPDLPATWRDVPTSQYSYFDGAMPLDQDWSLYRDPAQNP